MRSEPREEEQQFHFPWVVDVALEVADIPVNLLACGTRKLVVEKPDLRTLLMR